jgi:hypothetical protein
MKMADWKPNNDFSQRAAKGQAYNLAVSTAIAEGKQHDNEFIVKQFLRHLQFASFVQKATPEQLSDVLKNPKLIDLIRELDEAVK